MELILTTRKLLGTKLISNSYNIPVIAYHEMAHIPLNPLFHAYITENKQGMSVINHIYHPPNITLHLLVTIRDN